LKSKIQGTFITYLAYLEIKPNVEHIGPVGTEGILCFTASDA